MTRPVTTRLRFVSAKDPRSVQAFLDRLGFRVQVYGAPQWNGKRWYCWFVPGDESADVQSVDLE